MIEECHIDVQKHRNNRKCESPPEKSHEPFFQQRALRSPDASVSNHRSHSGRSTMLAGRRIRFMSQPGSPDASVAAGGWPLAASAASRTYALRAVCTHCAACIRKSSAAALGGVATGFRGVGRLHRDWSGPGGRCCSAPGTRSRAGCSPSRSSTRWFGRLAGGASTKLWVVVARSARRLWV